MSDQGHEGGGVPRRSELLARLARASKFGQYAEALEACETLLSLADLPEDQRARLLETAEQMRGYRAFSEQLRAWEELARKDAGAASAAIRSAEIPQKLSRPLYDRLAKLKTRVDEAEVTQDAEAVYRPRLLAWEERMARGDFAAVQAELDALLMGEELPEHIADELRDMSRRCRLVHMDVQKKVIAQRLRDIEDRISERQFREASTTLEQVLSAIEQDRATLGDFVLPAQRAKRRLEEMAAETGVDLSTILLEAQAPEAERAAEEVVQVGRRRRGAGASLAVGAMVLVVVGAGLWWFVLRDSGPIAADLPGLQQQVASAVQEDRQEAWTSLTGQASAEATALRGWLSAGGTVERVHWSEPLRRSADNPNRLVGRLEVGKRMGGQSWTGELGVLLELGPDGSATWLLESAGAAEPASHLAARQAQEREALLATRREGLRAGMRDLPGQIERDLGMVQVARYLTLLWKLDEPRIVEATADRLELELPPARAGRSPDVGVLRLRAEGGGDRPLRLTLYPSDVTAAQEKIEAHFALRVNLARASILRQLGAERPSGDAWSWKAEAGGGVAGLEPVRVQISGSYPGSAVVEATLSLVPRDLDYRVDLSPHAQALAGVHEVGPRQFTLAEAQSALGQWDARSAAAGLLGDRWPELSAALPALTGGERVVLPGAGPPYTGRVQLRSLSEPAVELGLDVELRNAGDIAAALPAEAADRALAALTRRRAAALQEAAGAGGVLAIAGRVETPSGWSVVVEAPSTLILSAGEARFRVELTWDASSLSYALPDALTLESQLSALAAGATRERVRLAELLDRSVGEGASLRELILAWVDGSIRAEPPAFLGQLALLSRVLRGLTVQERADSATLHLQLAVDLPGEAHDLAHAISVELGPDVYAVLVDLARNNRLVELEAQLAGLLVERLRAEQLDASQTARWRLVEAAAVLVGDRPDAFDTQGARLVAFFTRFNLARVIEEAGGEGLLGRTATSIELADLELRALPGRWVLAGRLRVGFGGQPAAGAGIPIELWADWSDAAAGAARVEYSPAAVPNTAGAEGVLANLADPAARAVAAQRDAGGAGQRAAAEAALTAQLGDRMRAGVSPAEAQILLLLLAEAKYPGQVATIRQLFNRPAEQLMAQVGGLARAAEEDAYPTHFAELFFGRTAVYALCWNVVEAGGAVSAPVLTRTREGSEAWTARLARDAAAAGAMLAELGLFSAAEPVWPLRADGAGRFGLMLAPDGILAALPLERGRFDAVVVEGVGVGTANASRENVRIESLGDLFVVPTRGRQWSETGRLVSLWMVPTLVTAQLEQPLSPADLESELAGALRAAGLGHTRVASVRPNTATGWPARSTRRREGQFAVVLLASAQAQREVVAEVRPLRGGNLFHPRSPATWVYQLLSTELGRDTQIRPVWLGP